MALLLECFGANTTVRVVEVGSQIFGSTSFPLSLLKELSATSSKIYRISDMRAILQVLKVCNMCDI